MFSLVDLLVAPFIIKTQHRNTEFVYHVRINFTVVVFSCESYTTTCQANLDAVESPVIIFQCRAITTAFFHASVTRWNLSVYLRDKTSKAIRRHAQASTIFNMIASCKIQLLIIQHPGRINLGAAYTIFIISFSVGKLW